MRPIAWLMGTALAVAFAAPAPSMVITSDKGGQIGAYVTRFGKVRRSGERVVIDGFCLSACTIVVGMIPSDRLCATRKAVLGFHAAWFPDGNGGMVPSREATQVLMKFYPPNLRQWIARRGGLSQKLILLQGSELAAIVPPCGGGPDRANVAATTTPAAARPAANAAPDGRPGPDGRPRQATPSRRAPTTIAPPTAAEAAMAR